MKAVPGRKTDVEDSQWLADLLRHGLLKASCIPPMPVRERRDLMRYRQTIVQQRADEVNRLQKVLETANLKLASVATDVLGKSGRESGSMPSLVVRTIHRREPSWHEDACGPNCRTRASRWMDGCNLITACCSRAFWRLSTFWKNPWPSFRRKWNTTCTLLRRLWNECRAWEGLMRRQRPASWQKLGPI